MIGVMVRNGWPMSEIHGLDFDQFELYVKDAYQAENDHFARAILAVNHGSHAKLNDLKRLLDDLTKPVRKKSMSMDEALKMAKSIPT